jgi:hypothetical protein
MKHTVVLNIRTSYNEAQKIKLINEVNVPLIFFLSHMGISALKLSCPQILVKEM